MKILMELLRSVAAVVSILAALFACDVGEGAASDGFLHRNSGTTTSSGGARLLFSSGFEGSIVLGAPSDLYGTGASQDIVGTDSTTGSTWPGNIWGGGIRLQMIVDAPVNATTLGNYMVNKLGRSRGVTGTRPGPLERNQAEGGPHHPGCPAACGCPHLPAREEGDMYISFWLKLQPDLLEKMTPQNWRMVFAWKTNGDYRVKAEIVNWEDGYRGVKPNGQRDNVANGGLPYQVFWKVENCSHPVPVDEWFKFEIFWHHSHLSEGRVWMAVNGQSVADDPPACDGRAVG